MVVVVQSSALLKGHPHAASCRSTTCMRDGHWSMQGGTCLDAACEGDAGCKAEVADICQVSTHHLQASHKSILELNKSQLEK